MKDLPNEFIEKSVSPWGGLRLIKETYRRSGLKGQIEQISENYLPLPASYRGYSPVDLIEGFIISILLGAKRLSHPGTLRNDHVTQRMFSWQKGMASQSTFSRFFKKFDQERNDHVFAALNRFWFSQIKMDMFTIDVDSIILSRYEKQEGINSGYNPKQPGRGSYHPLLAFVAEIKMVANAWMRLGESSASTDFESFIDELFEIIPKEQIGLFRADSGFYGDKKLEIL